MNRCIAKPPKPQAPDFKAAATLAESTETSITCPFHTAWTQRGHSRRRGGLLRLTEKRTAASPNRVLTIPLATSTDHSPGRVRALAKRNAGNLDLGERPLRLQTSVSKIDRTVWLRIATLV